MNIYQKLIEVRKVVPYLQKEQDGAQYKYVSSSQVLAAVKVKMDELGLLLIPRVTSANVLTQTVDTPDKEGKYIAKKQTTYFTELFMTFTWVNADEPDEKIECSWYGQGVDIAGEKGAGKAMTYAEKNFLLKQFNVATDKDDPDSFQQKNEQKQEIQDKKRLLKLTAEIKTAWVVKGLKPAALNMQLEKLYGVGLEQLNEDQAQEFIEKLRKQESA